MNESEPALHQINHYPEQMTAGDVVEPANMLAFGEYETPEQAVRDIIRWFLDIDTVPVESDYEVGAAAMQKAYEEGHGDGPALLKVGMDAALGIGDNELSKALECQHREVDYDRDICADCGAGIEDNDA